MRSSPGLSHDERPAARNLEFILRRVQMEDGRGRDPDVTISGNGLAALVIAPILQSSFTPPMPITLPALSAPAEILIDGHGIPHIRAGAFLDAFVVQGWNAARDRLWQIDLWRKRGLGLLAADFGPGYIEQDRASRLMLYRGAMSREWSSYAPDDRAICEAFVAGINAYIALCKREPERLPPEFGVMGTRPARWKATDVVRIRTHSLSRNGISEMLRAIVLAGADLETDLIRRSLEPPVMPRVPDGFDPATVPLAALDLLKLATTDVRFTPERLAAPLADAPKWRKVTDLGDVLRDTEFAGSNNWAVSAALSGTGAPILASDPHRAHALPSLRYIAHLTAPGLDVIGAGEACTPGISFGHNGTLAYSGTIFYIDQEDIVILAKASDDPDVFIEGRRRRPIRTLTETVKVKGQPGQPMRLRFSAHGPIFHETPSHAFAFRSVAQEPGTAPYLGSLTGMRETTVAGYAASLHRNKTPSTNHVFADTAGHIGWRPAGLAPIRTGYDGLLPVPANGQHRWSGFMDAADMPLTIDPPCGWVATANAMNLPADWDHASKPLGFEWVERSRLNRIEEVLMPAKAHGVGDAAALQTDVVSLPGRRMAKLVVVLPASAGVAAAQALFADWDGSLHKDSAAAALFEVWWMKYLKPGLLALLVNDPALRAIMVPIDQESALGLLEAPDKRFGAEAERRRDQLLASTLLAAWTDLSNRLGVDPSAWAWGKLHHGLFEHPLASVAGAKAAGLRDIGPWPMGGSMSTPMHTGYRLSDFRVIAGASFRMVVDLADPDRSICINSPGQSGDPRSRHYDDLAPIWTKGGYVPMPFTTKAVDAAALERISLVPA
ncbi:MAG: penicillin acylase family protein [Hyphomicrobiales bacterium]|nr:penicillin acylase family protein [Hyphomicrobiales bacterium]